MAGTAKQKQIAAHETHWRMLIPPEEARGGIYDIG